MRGVGQRVSLYNQRPHPTSSSAASTSSTGSGSPPSSVHMGQLDSGYTTPSNLTSASVNTQETSASSASSTTSSSSPPSAGATPAASPNTTAAQLMMGSNSMLSEINLQSYSTMPRHFVTHQRQHQGHQPTPGVHPAAQMAVMGTTGGTLQKVKRVYL